MAAGGRGVEPVGATAVGCEDCDAIFLAEGEVGVYEDEEVG